MDISPGVGAKMKAVKKGICLLRCNYPILTTIFVNTVGTTGRIVAMGFDKFLKIYFKYVIDINFSA